MAEVDSMVKFLHRVIKHGEVEVHQEHHSAHEIVLVWTVTVSAGDPIFKLKYTGVTVCSCKSKR